MLPSCSVHGILEALGESRARSSLKALEAAAWLLYQRLPCRLLGYDSVHLLLIREGDSVNKKKTSVQCPVSSETQAEEAQQHI